MKKFNIYPVLLAISLLFAWGCKKDYEPPMAENNHLFITTSAGDFALASIIYDTVSLIDLSRGIKSRTWSFGADSANIIDSDNDLTSTEQVCKVAFLIPGVYDVPLRQVYEGNAYVGTEQIGSTTFDTTIRVVIFDSVHASFVMERVETDDMLTTDYEGQAIELETGAKNKIWAGRFMRFFNTSTGGATSDWDIFRTDVDFLFEQNAVDSVWDYKFTSLGKYSVDMFAYSPYDNDAIRYDSLVQVTPSSDPILLDELNVVDEGGQSDNTDLLQMVFSRDMTTIDDSLLFYLNLLVSNGNDTIENITITKAEPDEISNNIIWLTVSEELFNSDNVRLSYNAAPGNSLRENYLFTSDGMAMPSFDDYRAQFEVVNIFEQLETDADWNFEGLAEGDFWLWNGWQDQATGITFDAGISRYERFSSPDNDGEYSLYFEVPSGGTRCIFPSDVPIEEYNYENKEGVTFRLPPGSYNFRALVYVEDLGGGVFTNAQAETMASELRIYLSDVVRGNTELWYNYSGLFDPNYSHVGQWAWLQPDNYFETDVAVDHYMTLRIVNRDNSGTIKLYIDRIEALVVEER